MARIDDIRKAHQKIEQAKKNPFDWDHWGDYEPGQAIHYNGQFGKLIYASATKIVLDRDGLELTYFKPGSLYDPDVSARLINARRSGKTFEEMSKEFNVSKGQLNKFFYMWHSSQDQVLRDNIHQSVDYIAEKLCKTPEAVEKRVKELGLVTKPTTTKIDPDEVIEWPENQFDHDEEIKKTMELAKASPTGATSEIRISDPVLMEEVKTTAVREVLNELIEEIDNELQQIVKEIARLNVRREGYSCSLGILLNKRREINEAAEALEG